MKANNLLAIFFTRLVVLLGLAFMPSSVALAATNVTSNWTGGTSSNWDSTTGNWSNGVPPLLNGTDIDFVVFNASPTGGHGTTTPITLSLNYVPGEMATLTFQSTAFTGTQGYTINATGSGSLSADLYDIQENFQGNGITETINAPLLGGTGGQNSGNITLANYVPLTASSAYQIATGVTEGFNDTLAISGAIQFTSASAQTLTLSGIGNGNVSGGISQSGGGAVTITLNSAGTWTLSGSEATLTGNTNIAGNGVLALNYATDPGDAKIGTGTLTFGGNSNLATGGGTLMLSGNTSGNSVSESPASIIVNQGASRIVIESTTSNTSLLSVANWSASNRSAGGSMLFDLGTIGAGVSKVVLPNANNTNGIFGGWAVYSDDVHDYTWALITNPLTANATISGFASYTNDTWGGTTTNTDVVTNGLTIASSATTNSLRFDSSTATNLTLSVNDTLASGGILVTPTVGSHTVTIAGTTSGGVTTGSLNSAANELIINQYDTAANASLDISANITFGTATAGNPGNGQVSGTLTIGGGGTVELDGTNFTNTSTSTVYTTTIYLNQGKLILGSNGALGTESPTGTVINDVVVGPQTVLDLHGFNATVAQIRDNPNNDIIGSLLAAAGATDAITNSAAGTISNLTIQNKSGTSTASSGQGLSYLTGGLTEASGAILSLTVGQSTWLDIGTPNDTNNTTGTTDNVGLAGNSINGAFNLITGGINTINGGLIQANDSSYLLSLGMFYTTSTGSIVAPHAGTGTIGATYLGGSSTSSITDAGSVTSGENLLLNLIGSTPDIYSGSISGTSSLTVVLNLEGTGTLSLTNPLNTTTFTTTLGETATLITPSITAPLQAYGIPTLELTGTSGSVETSQLQSGNLILWINPAAPTGAPGAITVGGLTNANSYFLPMSENTIKLSANGNTSVDFLMGSGSADVANTGGGTGVGLFYRQQQFSTKQGTVIIAAGDGLANLGTTDKLNFFVPTSILPTITNGEVASWVIGQDKDANKTGSFLTYAGNTGTSTDAGFEVYTPSATTFSTGMATTSTVDIQNSQAITYTTTASQSIYSLEIDANDPAADSGGTISADSGSATTGALSFTGGTGTYALTISGNGLILNGGSLSGTHLNIVQSSSATNPFIIYTSLAGGTITTPAQYSNTFTDVMGPGPLTFGATSTFANNSTWFLEGGALDLSQTGAAPTTQLFNLQGGVLELNGANGVFAPTLGIAVGVAGDEVSWVSDSNNINPSAGGGFAARGTSGAGSGNLLIALNGTSTIATPVVWGTNDRFVLNGSVLMFGATNANSIVNLENALNLGFADNAVTVGTGNTEVANVLFRAIQVTAATGDSSNPFAVSDPAVLSGIISSNASFYGIGLTGNGVLVLSNSGNTYTGATSIGGTSSLLINNDTDLGTAPTAPYALNVDSVSGIAGGAITPGAVVINGGATLGIYFAQGATPGTYATTTGEVDLSTNRTILLAGGATSPVASNINVQTGTTAVFNGLIGDYVGEKGRLNKNGLGTLNLGGNNNSYTGGTTVSAGRLNVNNTAGSGTGTGSVSVASGATLGGTGIIQPGAATAGVSLASGATFTPGAFSGSAVTSQMTLDNTTAASTILNAASGSTLVFSLGAGNSGIAFTPSVGSPNYSQINIDSTYLNVLGSTPSEMLFAGTGVTITVNDLTAGTGLQFYNNQAYLLIKAGSNADYSGIVTDTGTTGGVANNGFVLNTNLTLNGTATTDYNGLELYLDNGDLLVVPEPGTWAMLASGLVFLLVYQSRRRRNVV